jgi:hypothetical protein
VKQQNKLRFTIGKCEGGNLLELDALIQFWQTIVTIQGYLISPSMQVIVTDTIKALEELKKLKGE